MSLLVIARECTGVEVELYVYGHLCLQALAGSNPRSEEGLVVLGALGAWPLKLWELIPPRRLLSYTGKLSSMGKAHYPRAWEMLHSIVYSSFLNKAVVVLVTLSNISSRPSSP